MSPPVNSPGMTASRLPSASTMVWSIPPVWHRRTSRRIPIRSSTTRWVSPLKSLAAGTEHGRLLDDGDGVAGAAQPVGERGSGDARTGDEDRAVLHGHELRGER
ncbi:hypothetical protein [Streptosporangium sp. NBC_01755]|uniref:hypothetical protein n=1 Tax=Streptosporangium sp. NBC_01755 TaxID=2975949 RepID=UPI003FA398E5